MHHSFHPLLATALLIISGFTSCQKAQIAPTTQTDALLVGRWYLTQTSGGIGGGTQPANPQQRYEMVFGADGQAQMLLNGTPTATSTYTLAQAVAATTQRTETFISYTGPQLNGHPFIGQLSATTLVLSDDNPDGLGTTYQRVMPLICGNR